jgi:hypothetical protein
MNPTFTDNRGHNHGDRGTIRLHFIDNPFSMETRQPFRPVMEAVRRPFGRNQVTDWTIGGTVGAPRTDWCLPALQLLVALYEPDDTQDSGDQ